MNNEDAELWRAALIAYCYPVSRVQVSCFARRLRLGAPWFTFNLEQGSRDQTIALEERFRGLGRDHIESWFEVIFWKLASTKRLGEWRAKEMIKRLRENKCVASSMWAACTDFVDSGSRGSFESLQRELFMVSKSIPVAATFPAFMCPERFPMADSQVAKWVDMYKRTYSDLELVTPSSSFLSGRTTLNVSGDWDFYSKWIAWCRRAATVLSDETGVAWRARDVEMAAFENKRHGAALLPSIA